MRHKKYLNFKKITVFQRKNRFLNILNKINLLKLFHNRSFELKALPKGIDSSSNYSVPMSLSGRFNIFKANFSPLFIAC